MGADCGWAAPAKAGRGCPVRSRPKQLWADRADRADPARGCRGAGPSGPAAWGGQLGWHVEGQGAGTVAEASTSRWAMDRERGTTSLTAGSEGRIRLDVAVRTCIFCTAAARKGGSGFRVWGPREDWGG